MVTRLPRSQTPVADDRRLRLLGILIIVIVFGGFGGWALLAPLSDAAQAPGVIALENYRKIVQHLEGGIVKAIHVRDGDLVEKGQVLLTLEDTQPRAQLEVLRGQYYFSLAHEARLIAQRDGLGKVNYPKILLDNRQDERVQEAIRVQDQTFRVRRASYEGEAGLYRQQIGQLQAKMAGLKAQRASREQLISSFQKEVDDYADLLKEGYAEVQKVRDMQRNLAQTEGQRGELTSSIAGTELEISETRLKILQLQKELQREVAKELAEVQTQQFELGEKLQSVQDMVTRTVIKAPQGGKVLGLAVHTLGAVVRPGEKLMDIVPQGEKLIVEAKVSTNDIDRVHPGQTAEIRFPAFKMRDTPKIEGTLLNISADRLVDENDPNKTPYYLARVAITPKGLEDLAKHKLDLVAGMPAEVMIQAGERTFFRYLIDPLRNTVARSFTEQ